MTDLCLLCVQSLCYMFLLLQHSYDIMVECWHETPVKRLSFTQLRAKFDSLLAAQQGNVYIDLKTNEFKDYYSGYHRNLQS